MLLTYNNVHIPKCRFVYKQLWQSNCVIKGVMNSSNSKTLREPVRNMHFVMLHE